MIPIVVILMLAVFFGCLGIAFKTTKAKIITISISAIVIIAIFSIAVAGFANVTKNSHVVAQVTVGEQKRDLFYDSEKDVYFLSKSYNWRIFYPQYRVIVDYDVAKQYVEHYNELQQFDFADYALE